MIDKIFLGFVYDVINKSYKSTVKLPKTETDILINIRDSIVFLEKSNSLALQSTDLLKSFVGYLESDVISEIDKLSSDYFILNPQEKKSVLRKTITNTGLLWNALRDSLISCSFEELQSELNQLILRVYPDRSALLVQSARECDIQLKSEIRSHNKNKFYVSFQIQKNLLGGMRVYADSVLVDTSWLGKITSLNSI